MIRQRGARVSISAELREKPRLVAVRLVTMTIRPVMPRGQDPLTAGQRTALVTEVLASYCTVRWALHGQDLPRAVAQLRRGAGCEARNTEGEDGHRVASRLGYVVGRTLGFLPTESRCLMRSLVLVRLLARRGLPCSLVLGVSAAPEFGAHAWVEHSGLPVLPAYGRVFSRLVEL